MTNPSIDQLINRLIVSAPSLINSLTSASHRSSRLLIGQAPRNILRNLERLQNSFLTACLCHWGVPIILSTLSIQHTPPSRLPVTYPERYTLLKGSVLNDFKHTYHMYFDFLHIHLWSAIIFFFFFLIKCPHPSFVALQLQGTAEAHGMETLTTMTSTPCLWGFLHV